MDNLCQAHHCSNVIRGRRKDARYCSESCKQVQKRYNKENGFVGVRRQSNVTPVKIDSTGSLVADASASAAIGLISNGAADPMTTVTTNVLNSCIPYAFRMIQERPLLSVFLAFGGVKFASHFLKSCSITTTIDKDGKKDTSKTCKPASALQKSGGAALAVLGGNHLLDQITTLSNANSAVSDTGQTRVRHGFNPSNPSLSERILENLKLDNDIVFNLKAN